MRYLLATVGGAALLLSIYGVAAQPTSQTVNSYTPAQEQKARAAAKAAGYDSGKVLFAQAGNFFFNASREGRRYALTVTPEGKVYASTPLD
jgi:hypothetical protein